MVLGVDEKINGVNLGNWLVLEKWMNPEPFQPSGADDEIRMHRTHAAMDAAAHAPRKSSETMESSSLESVLRRHRDTYITLDDFRAIAAHGINLVRIPVPYFIFGDWPGHPGCVEYLDKAFAWADETGLKIMIDLHTVPGSQNGFDNGGLTGVCTWARNPDLVEYALNVLERLACRYRDEPALHSIEVLNEPVSWLVFHGASNIAKNNREASGSAHVSLRFLKRFYRAAYTRLRAILRPETPIVFHDGFRLLRWGDWFRRAGMRNVMLDTHQYLIAMESPIFAVRMLRERYLGLRGNARRITDMGVTESAAGSAGVDAEAVAERLKAPWAYRLMLGLASSAIRHAARHVPVLVGEWCVENRWSLEISQVVPSDLRMRRETVVRAAYRTIARLQRESWNVSAGQIYWSYQLSRSLKPCSGEGEPPRDPRNGGNLEAWDLTRAWRHGWILPEEFHDDAQDVR